MSLEISIDVKIPDTALFRGEGSQIVQEQLVADTEYAVNAILGAVVPETPVGATSALRGAWQTKVDVLGSKFDVLGTVFNPMGYAVVRERGRRPGWPPREPIEYWVRRKLGISGDKEVRSVAFLVARKIARVGTTGAAMAHKGVEKVEPAIQARFRAGLDVVLQRLSR
jgi:hypothetical protein